MKLTRNYTFSVPSIYIRKIKTSIDNLALEKQKLEKGDKPKKKAGGAKVKGKLRMEADVSSLLFSQYSKILLVKKKCLFF